MMEEETAPAQKHALMYTHPTCGYCDLLKSDFDKEGITYDEVDLSVNSDAWSEVERLSGGDRITPVTVMPNGEVKIGYKGIGCNYG